MQTQIKNLISIAEFCGDTSTKVVLEKWLHSQENGEKILPFIGRFSAGKSTLINSLIKDKILPTARVETTAALTRISYSSAPNVTVVFTDGTQKNITIPEISALTHSNMGESETEIASINIGLPLDILKTGLTIVDSPGMDTILNNHVALAQYLMSEAVIVVYVMSGAPTAFDMGIMSQLQKNGVGIIAARTHMDTLKEEEESFLEAVDNDEKILAELESPVAYFALSSSDEAIDSMKDSLCQFENYLKDEVALKINEVYKQRISQRLLKIEEKFKQDLLSQRQLFESHTNKSEAEFNADIKSINKAVTDIETSIDSLQTKLSKEKAKIKMSLLEEVDDEIDYAVKGIKRQLSSSFDSLPASHDAQQKYMEEMFQQNLAVVSQKISDNITSKLSEWASRSASDVGEGLLHVANELKELNIPFDPDIDLNRVNDIAEQQEALLEKIEFLTQQSQALASFTDAQLSELGTKRDTIQKTLEELEEAHQQAVDALQYLQSNYQPHYIDKPSKMGKIMSRIGNAGDIAMLAIPAIGWEKGAAMLASKAAAMAEKTGKVAKISQKALTFGSNVATIMAKTDTTKDAVMLLDMTTKRISDKNVEESKEALVRVSNSVLQPQETVALQPQKPSVFDYLSLSYWFGRFGEWIDPPTREIDMEYENRYREARQACEYNAFMSARRRIDEERELGRIKSEEQAKEVEHKFRQDSLAREKAQCEKRIQNLSKKKEEAIKLAFIDSATSQFKDAASKIEKHVHNHIDGIMESIYLQILSAASQNAYSQLNSAKEKLEEMKGAKNTAQEELMSPIIKIDQFLALLPK